LVAKGPTGHFLGNFFRVAVPFLPMLRTLSCFANFLTAQAGDLDVAWNTLNDVRRSPSSALGFSSRRPRQFTQSGHRRRSQSLTGSRSSRGQENSPRSHRPGYLRSLSHFTSRRSWNSS
jgi:hypothetical protein